jgi:NAD(P)H-flavin reductase/predicted pyridoxine 5'-phosphate oxidase superfamily flavin-nucleotide-binding protein
MATIFMAQPWHQGEQKMHQLMKVPEYDNPTTAALTPQAAFMLQRAPLLAIGTLDAQSRPWTSLWGGETGFSRPLGGDMVGIRADVDTEFDPVVDSLVSKEKRASGDIIKSEGQGAMVGGLTIDLMSRKRVKIYGRMVAGAVSSPEDEGMGIGDMQLVCKVEQSLGNCPKYLNKRDIRPAPARPRLISKSPKLSTEGQALIEKADMFFISSSNSNNDMDTNHRGGPAGFVRTISNDEAGAEIIYPEYSGNRLYQTLGNLMVTPLAGIVFPDFDTGDVLYITGVTTVLIGKDAANFLPHSNLAVKIKITEARFVSQGLPFRGIPDELSPYNPSVRLLPSEGNIAAKLNAVQNTASLVERTEITPTISRYRFTMTHPTSYKPGQWVAMDFSDELDIGYSHMRDDDPTSLNDDFVRTFTVSNPPLGTETKSQAEFEITIRKHGPVTTLLSRTNARSDLEVPLRGFGGDFVIETPESAADVPFIAGGVGITPVLGQLTSLNLNKLMLFWIIKTEDAGFVLDVLRKHKDLAKRTTVFFTGTENPNLKETQKADIERIKAMGANTEVRRPVKEDFDVVHADKWYLCAGLPLRSRLLEWLKGKTVLYESFDY